MENCLICVFDSLRFDIIQRDFEDGIISELDLMDHLDTPALDRLTELGAVTPRLHSVSPGTHPSVASILTGLFPRQHGAVTPSEIMDENINGLEKSFAQANYHTMFWTDWENLHPALNTKKRFDEIGRGSLKRLTSRIKELNSAGKKVFAFYHTDDLHGPYMMSRFPPNEDYHDKAIEWGNKIARELNYSGKKWSRSDSMFPSDKADIQWESNMETPLWNFFREMQVFSPDWLKNAPPQRIIELLVEMYIEGINHYDRRQLSELERFLLDEPGGKDTLAVITADHGQTIRHRDKEYECGIDTFYHGSRPVQELLRIPALWINSSLSQKNLDRWPLTSCLDIAPTIVSQLDIEPLFEHSGSDLSAVPPDKRKVFSEFALPFYSTQAKKSGYILEWENIIDSEGLKYYRQCESINESDYQLPLSDFLFVCFLKIDFECIDASTVKQLSEQFEQFDSLALRRKIVQDLEKQSSSRHNLYNWKEDHQEEKNLLNNSSEQWLEEAEKLGAALDEKFGGCDFEPVKFEDI